MAELVPTRLFGIRFNRAFDIATVIAVAIWQVTAALTALVAHGDHYTSFALAAAVWAVQLVIVVAGAALLLRRVRRAAVIWPLVAVDIVTGAAIVTSCPGGEHLKINWAWATVGLIGVLLLLHRPLCELIVLLILNAGIVLVALVVTGALHRHSAAGFVTLGYASASIQLALMAGARVFQFSGGMAAEAAAERWAIATQEAIFAEVAVARQDRYQAVQARVAPILQGLAGGTISPADPDVRHRCAAAEAVLRRLLTEQDDVPHPMLRALQSGIDAAVRRGVIVDVTPIGTPPPMTEELGTALVEIPLAVLATARTHARITVVAAVAGGISISILTEGDAAVPHRPSTDGVIVTSDRDGDLFWLEARWESQ
ncbi:hypothetical protein AB0H37_43685 [Actinomadura sp. NPDC023710]|uniref:hypothetical protein n=1 Tax=Actinomadura sp. NPDC023710 TaxID=3158219 RepID=UPI0033FE06E2